MRGYLEELNIKQGTPETWAREDIDRLKKWEEQVVNYGFDERETWDMCYSFRLWLYEHLRMYLDMTRGKIDLTYHRFDYNGHNYTQSELIDQMIKRLKAYFAVDSEWELTDDYLNWLNEIEDIWAVVARVMWW